MFQLQSFWNFLVSILESLRKDADYGNLFFSWKHSEFSRMVLAIDHLTFGP